MVIIGKDGTEKNKCEFLNLSQKTITDFKKTEPGNPLMKIQGLLNETEIQRVLGNIRTVPRTQGSEAVGSLLLRP